MKITRDVEYLTTAEAARLLDVSKRTLTNWITKGVVPSPEVDPRNAYYRWTLKDIEDIRRTLKERS